MSPQAALPRFVRSYPLALACALASLVCIVAAVYRHGRIGEIQEGMQEQQDKLEQISRNSRYSLSLADDLAHLDAYSARIAASIVEPDAKASNLAYIYELGSRRNVTVRRADQKDLPKAPADDKKGPKPEFENYVPFSFELGVEGAFPDLVRFLDALGRDRFLIRYDSLSVKQGDILSGRVESADIVITVLSAKPEPKK